jgi:hypothetical protein
MLSFDLVRQGYFLLLHPELEYGSGDAHSCVPASRCQELTLVLDGS